MDGFRIYLKGLLSLAAPIALQQLIFAGLGMLDTMLVGQLGDTAIATVGLAMQVWFVLSLLYFGLSSGSAIFIAQFWGKQDLTGIRKIYTLNLILNFIFGLLFTILAQTIPHTILSIFTEDPQVIQLGSQYLRIYSVGWIFSGLSYGTYIMLRSTENAKIPLVIGGATFTISTLLSYCLIFGNFGLPEMGIFGAALANTTSRILEFFATLIVIKYNRSLTAARPGILMPDNWGFVRKYLLTALPVAANEAAWSLGISAYTAVYAHIGTEAITATNIAGTFENLAFVPFIGLANASAILTGKMIGAGEPDKAYHFGKRVILINVLATLAVSLIILAVRSPVLGIYKITAMASSNARQVLSALSIFLFAKTTNMMIVIGILRAGGDTRFPLFAELGSLWLIGVPAALLASNIFKLPVYWVAAIVYAEELIRLVIFSSRFKSRRWIHNLAMPVA